MPEKKFLLYGANGYTGQLIANLSGQYDLQPILAGRRKESIQPLADKLGLDYHIISLDETKRLENIVFDLPLVLNAAGPFNLTAKPVIDACLSTGTHYLDITGEIEVFELAKTYGEKAKNAGIIILPGVGFDVVPTDCIALFLKNLLPDANKLTLAFSSLHGRISHGTAVTMLQNLGRPGAVRKNGVIKKTPVGHNGMWIDFGIAKHFVMSIPWGDISTAYHTTGIPDIETYTGISKQVYQLLKFQNSFNWILRAGIVKKLIKKKIDKKPAGPTETERQKGKSMVWGSVTNQEGKTVRARLTGPESYTLTAHSSLLITKKILEGNFAAGYHTPAELFGENLVMKIPGVERELIIDY